MRLDGCEKVAEVVQTTVTTATFGTDGRVLGLDAIDPTQSTQLLMIGDSESIAVVPLQLTTQSDPTLGF
ncbi:hypothetical protein PGT21_002969 [Puccinia graminis f. sp. tritici]|uniref:Uncharacterized protein n=1 Tax=Puccinia graminis f. sp. tritici TaxID=56615 RepID=A0A5B0M0B3_PUCGR|nr:hypothetical protein PGT21_002969 [Puccinia graminis f. sp. tritici]